MKNGSLNLFKDILKVHPTAIILKLLLAIIGGLTLPLITFTTQKMIDSISIDSSMTFHYLFLLAFLFVLSIVTSHFDSYLNIQISNRIDFVFGKNIIKKSSNIPYHYFENNNTYEISGRVLDKYETTLLGTISIITSCIRITTMFIGFFYYLVFIRWWILPMLLITLVPVFLITIYASMKEYDTFSKFYPHHRKANYYSGLLTSRGAIKETRLFQYGKFVEKLWETSIKKYQNAQVRSNLGPRFIIGFCILLQYAVIILNLFILYPSVTRGDISIGLYIALAQSMWILVGSFQYEIIDIIKNIANYHKFKKDYDEFNNYPDNSSAINTRITLNDKIEIFSEIKLTDIWYQYNENNPFVLQGIDLKIQYGEKMGIVGENGSGKSTLIKIILGLLPPTKGTITVDGILITDENRYLLKHFSSAVFQDYGHYNLTLSESISLSDITNSADIKRMNDIILNLRKDDDFLVPLKNGIDTELGKERWEGQDLSGGQWQTIALARGIFANKSLLVLDEPTAALDPLSEVDVYNHIYQSNDIQTVILVTHRLGAIVMADRILLLENGMLSETGTHLEMLKKQGRYAKMFETQSQWYNKPIQGDFE